MIRLITLLLIALQLPSFAAILMLDFEGPADSVSPITQNGFQSFDVSKGNTQVFSDITVKLNSNQARIRTDFPSSSNVEYHHLLRDVIVGLQTAEQNISSGFIINRVLTFSGLESLTEYDIQIWSYTNDHDHNNIFNWYNTTSGNVYDVSAEWIGSVQNQHVGASASVDENAFSVMARVTSNANGELSFGTIAHSPTNSNRTVGSAAINGVKLTAVPEPSRMLLSACGLLMLFGQRRRWRHRTKFMKAEKFSKLRLLDLPSNSDAK